MRQLLIREHTLRMHHVEDDDRVAAQLDEYHVRELVNDQFARSGNPVAFADTLGVRGKRFDLPDDAALYSSRRAGARFEIIVGEDFSRSSRASSVQRIRIFTRIYRDGPPGGLS